MKNKLFLHRFTTLVVISFIISFFTSFNVAMAVGDAYFQQATTVSLTVDGVSTNFTIDAESDADTVVVDTSTVKVTISPSQRFTFISTDKKKLNNDGGINEECASTQSSLVITVAAAKTIIITPSSATCTTGTTGSTGAVASSGGGGGGGGSAPVSSTPTPTPTATPSSSAAPTPTVSVAPTTTPSVSTPSTSTSLVSKIKVKSGITLNVRNTNSTKGKVVNKIKSGEEYTYTQLLNGWYKIQKDGKDFGWVSAGYVTKATSTQSPIPTLTPSPKSTASSFNKVKVKPGITYLNVRNANSTKGKIVGKVKPGEEYVYTQLSNGWYKIQKDGKDFGWVSGQYVKKI